MYVHHAFSATDWDYLRRKVIRINHSHVNTSQHGMIPVLNLRNKCLFNYWNGIFRKLCITLFNPVLIWSFRWPMICQLIDASCIARHTGFSKGRWSYNARLLGLLYRPSNLDGIRRHWGESGQHSADDFSNTFSGMKICVSRFKFHRHLFLGINLTIR